MSGSPPFLAALRSLGSVDRSEMASQQPFVLHQRRQRRARDWTKSMCSRVTILDGFEHNLECLPGVRTRNGVPDMNLRTAGVAA